MRIIKNVMERAIQYIKDRTKECFGDHLPYKDNCNREHVRNWLSIDVVLKQIHNGIDGL